jgi:ABC-type transport system involved in Fe-S cluster assembly fused permease/ATPase subunit
MQCSKYLTSIRQPLNSLGTLYRVILTNLVDTDQLMNLLAEEKEIKDKPNAQELPVPAKGDIVFDNVSFSYDGKVQALKGVSFRVPAGTSVALVSVT